jgi:hypothetical protein
VALVVLAAVSTSCGGTKAVTPTGPDSGVSRPTSPPSPTGIMGSVGRAPVVVAFLVGSSGGFATYGFFLALIFGAVVGFMDVLDKDDKADKGQGPKP